VDEMLAIFSNRASALSAKPLRIFLNYKILETLFFKSRALVLYKNQSCSMSFVKILVHAVWAIKDRKPLMNKERKDAICQHLRENAVKKNIYLLNVNGWQDHVHCLISLSADQNIATVMNLLKGESSYWANRNVKWSEKFGWQDEYFAVSVSQSHFDIINNYINNQEDHHSRKTYQKEYEEFMRAYGFDFGDNIGQHE
jgi:REP element-mobilizing transposase RayT